MSALGISARRAGNAFTIYALLVFLIGALIAVPTLWYLQSLSETAPLLHEWTASLLKLLALFGLVPLCALLGIGWRQAIALRSWRENFQHAFVGLAIGAASMSGLVAILLLVGVRHLEPSLDVSMLLIALAKGLVVAVLVATLEECWFRGALHSVLRPCGSLVAVLGIALVYAALHFVRPDTQFAEPYIWLDGFRATTAMFSRFEDFAHFDSALALLFVGVMLGLAREWSGSIALSFGLHAGWVWVIQSARRITSLHHPNDSWLVGSYDGFIGVGFCALAVIACVFSWPWINRYVAAAKPPTEAIP